MSRDRNLRVVGLDASPCLRKSLAALRCRRLPFRLAVAGSQEARARPASPLAWTPNLIAPDADGMLGCAKADTTPVLSFLDHAYPDRRWRPDGPALPLLDLLIEDFGCLGPMTTLVVNDPTAEAIACAISPRSFACTERREDLSRLEFSEADWLDLSNAPHALCDRLSEIAKVYSPYSLANAAAVNQGAVTMHGEIDGFPGEQDTFAYQSECLSWLREACEALSHADAPRVDRIPNGTGCEELASGL